MTLRTIGLIVILALGILAAPLATEAQAPAKVPRIGFLGVASASSYASEVEAVRAGLRDFGYVDGKNIVIEYRWAEGKHDRLTEVAAELVRLKVDVIVTHATTGTRAAKQATTTIPIVIADAADPVAAGLVASLARPGGNITGSTSFQSELNVKRLELLKEAMPRITRVAVLLNANNPANMRNVKDMEIAAKSMRVGLHQFAASGPKEFDGAFTAMAKRRVDAVVIVEDPMLNADTGTIATLAAKQRLPSSGFRKFAEAGGLMAYGVNRLELYRRAAYFVDRILKGAKPGDLPIEQATKFELIINLKTAKALDLKIPQSVLIRADEVIQ